MNRKNLFCIILTLVLVSTVKVNSQTTSRGEVDFGFYQISGHPLSNKFLEYKDYRENLVLNSASYWLGSNRGFLEARIKGVSKNDQSSSLRLGKYGRYYLEGSWDQIPHFFSNHSRLFLSETQKGGYSIADSMQSRLQAASADTQATRLWRASYLSQAQRFPLSYRRDKAIGEVKISPTRDINLKISYSNEKRKGYKATGAETGSPGTFSVIELPEQIDFLTHQVEAQAQYSQKDWSLRADYQASIFDNKLETLVWDVPVRLTDTTAGSIRASRGRIGVAPDNWAQNASITGFVKLPFNIQSRGTFGFGLAKQNQDFLPHTINSAIVDTELVLPKSSLDGEIRTFTGNYFVSARPVKAVSLEANFRYYEFDNQTNEIVFPGYVADGDHTLETAGRASLPYEYKKSDFSFKIGVKPTTKLSYGLEIKRQNLDRVHRNVRNSNENTFVFSVDFYPALWFSMRNSYAHSNRNAEDYDPDAVEETFPEGEATLNPHLEELRRFDQIDRDRERLVSQASIDLGKYADLMLGANIYIDNYPKTEYGLEAGRSTALSAGVNLYPISKVSFYIDYTREFLYSKLQSRYRNVVSGAGTDNPLDDWGTRTEDLSDIISTGFFLDVLPKELSWQANYTYSYTRGKNSNFFVPFGSGSGDAPAWPLTHNELHLLNSFIRYKLSSQVSLIGEYRFEKYFVEDFAIDNLAPQMVGVNNQGIRSVLLAVLQPDYEAHLFGLRIGYEF